MALRRHMAQLTITSSQVCSCPPIVDVNAFGPTTHTGRSLIDLFAGRCGGYVKLEDIANSPNYTKMKIHPAENIAVAQKDSTEGQQKYSKPYGANRNSKRTKKVTFSCTMCTHTTSYRPYLSKHVANVHGQVTSHICRWCKKAFATKQTLQRHRRSVHKDRSSIKCPIANCSKYLISNQVLRQHLNAIHTKKIAFNCTMCAFKSYYKCSLKKHLDLQHREKSSTAASQPHCTLRLRTNNM